MEATAATAASDPSAGTTAGARRAATLAATLRRLRLGGWRRTLVVGAPALFILVTLLHPVVRPLGREGASAQQQDRLALWLAVHVALPAAAGLVAAALTVLLRGLPGRAAAVSRVAQGVFVAAYAMFATVVSLAGVLTRFAARVSGAERDAVFAARLGLPIGPLLLLADAAWLVAAVAAAVALRRAGAPRWPVGLLVAAGVVFAVDHAPPFGPAGMALFLAAVVTLLRAAARAGPRPA